MEPFEKDGWSASHIQEFAGGSWRKFSLTLAWIKSSLKKGYRKRCAVSGLRLQEVLFPLKSLTRQKLQLSALSKEEISRWDGYFAERRNCEENQPPLQAWSHTWRRCSKSWGRLSRAAMPDEARHPVILAKDLHITDLVLHHIHQRTGHGGCNHIICGNIHNMCYKNDFIEVCCLS